MCLIATIGVIGATVRSLVVMAIVMGNATARCELHATPRDLIPLTRTATPRDAGAQRNVHGQADGTRAGRLSCPW
jgi:hypothetical protein